MAVAFVSASANWTVGTGTSTAVPAPASIVAGNLLMAVMQVMYGTASAGASSGWTKQTELGAGTAAYIAVFTKTATGSEPGSYTFTWTGVSYGAVNILQYSGTTGLDGTSQLINSTTANTSIAAPSITPSVTGDMWVAAAGQAAGANPSLPAGFTSRSIAGGTGTTASLTRSGHS